ncbi:MAG TPA: hypothetical protein VGQ00_04210 [Candidatus Norongarragalinales archaeon]|jgi:uncharacterized protein YoxC|nr:hypothetical protein [Candidatus Norongarragalinales archaeon]
MAEFTSEELQARLQELKDAVYFITEKLEKGTQQQEVKIDFDPLIGALNEVRDALGILARQTRENGESVKAMAQGIGQIPSPKQLEDISRHIDSVHSDYVKALGEVAARTQSLAESVSQISRANTDVGPALTRLNSKLDAVPTQSDIRALGNALTQLSESVNNAARKQADAGTRELSSKIENLASFEQSSLSRIAEGINGLAQLQSKANAQLLDALVSMDKSISALEQANRQLSSRISESADREQVDVLSKRLDGAIEQLVAFNSLVEYVKEYTRRGYPPEAIKQTLVTAGWSSLDVEKALALIQAPKI